jgi:hypothetical protein
VPVTLPNVCALAKGAIAPDNARIISNAARVQLEMFFIKPPKMKSGTYLLF